MLTDEELEIGLKTAETYPKDVVRAGYTTGTTLDGTRLQVDCLIASIARHRGITIDVGIHRDLYRLFIGTGAGVFDGPGIRASAPAFRREIAKRAAIRRVKQGLWAPVGWILQGWRVGWKTVGRGISRVGRANASSAAGPA